MTVNAKPSVLEQLAVLVDGPGIGFTPRRSFQALSPRWTNDPGTEPHRAMVDAYQRIGGLLSGEDVVGLLRAHSAQPISMLARWIVDRRVVSFVWRSQTWLPAFQFDPADMSLRRGAAQAIDELADTFDDWELATWFVQPNSWLQQAAPIDLIDVDHSAVLQAARADRFISRG